MTIVIVSIAIFLIWFGLSQIIRGVNSKISGLDDIDSVKRIQEYARPLETFQKVSVLSLIIIISVIFYRYFNIASYFIIVHVHDLGPSDLE